jgi:CP family cyanate transporter-like MFS transporter
VRSGSGLRTPAAIVLLALNLRTVIASLPPLLSGVRADLGLSAGLAGLLTTLPVVCFGALAPITPRVAHRISLERLLLGCAALTVVAAALRGAGGTAALFAGSLLAGVAVAGAQAAIPVFIRTAHPRRTGPLIGAYSMALPTGATLAAAISVPLERAFGGSWRAALAIWALPAVAACAAWLPSALGPGTRLSGEEPRTPVWNERLGWWVSLYFGVQSTAFYAGLAWLPTILESGGAGASSEGAGLLQALASLVSVVPAFLVPLLAARRPRQTAMLVAIVLVPAAGILGLLVAPGAAPAWVVLIGLGQGGALGLALILPTLRARGPRPVAALTAMSLCVGYLVAASGPWILGVVHDATGGWRTPLVVLLAITLLELVPGVPAARDRQIGRPTPPRAPRASRRAWRAGSAGAR